jgi:hypothetical protein
MDKSLQTNAALQPTNAGGTAPNEKAGSCRRLPSK